MKVRDTRKALSLLGCSVARRRGSHEIWVTPSGKMLPPLVVHKRKEISRRILQMVIRSLREEGLDLENLSEATSKVRIKLRVCSN